MIRKGSRATKGGGKQYVIAWGCWFEYSSRSTYWCISSAWNMINQQPHCSKTQRVNGSTFQRLNIPTLLIDCWSVSLDPHLGSIGPSCHRHSPYLPATEAWPLLHHNEQVNWWTGKFAVFVSALKGCARMFSVSWKLIMGSNLVSRP